MSESATLSEIRSAPLQAAADKLRELKQKLAALATQEDRLRQQIAAVEQGVLAYMHRHGLSSARVDGALFYTEVHRTPTVLDWEAFRKFVVENGDLGYLHRRVSSTAVEEYLAEHGAPPPGITVQAETRLRFRSR